MREVIKDWTSIEHRIGDRTYASGRYRVYRDEASATVYVEVHNSESGQDCPPIPLDPSLELCDATFETTARIALRSATGDSNPE